MLHLLRALVFFLVASGAIAADVDPPARIGRLNESSGPVSFASGEAPDSWSEAVLNRPLTSGDRLWADRGARGELHVGSIAVRFASLTQLDVLHLDDHAMQLGLREGVLNMRVRELDYDERIEVVTPAGAAVLREPGSYRISADPATGVTYIAVNFGRAEVLTGSQSFVIPADQVAVVPTGGQVAFTVAGQPDEFDRWSADRDRREDGVMSTRYVSPHMTGYEDLDRYGSWRTVPEYGAVWVPARVASGWAPYRYGRWIWVSPWGWTWIDDAPWGFAPFHYGRWVWVHDYWAWAPGRLVRRPVYAPALVAFVGGPHGPLSVGHGPAVGWFPLGWREPFRPWYRSSHTHVRNVNVPHVGNVSNVDTVHAHRHRPHAVTMVPHQRFVSGARTAEHRLPFAQTDLARAQVLRDRTPADPARAAIPREAPARRPPAVTASPDAVVGTRPPHFRREGAAGPRSSGGHEQPSRPGARPALPQTSPSPGTAIQQPSRSGGGAGFQQPSRAAAGTASPQASPLPGQAIQQPGGVPERRQWGHDRAPRRESPPNAGAAQPRPGNQQPGHGGQKRGDGHRGSAGRPGSGT